MVIMDMSDIVEQLEEENKDLKDICTRLVTLLDEVKKSLGYPIASAWFKASNIAADARKVLAKHKNKKPEANDSKDDGEAYERSIRLFLDNATPEELEEWQAIAESGCGVDIQVTPK